jgi:thymidylate synthase (FAD)
MGFIKCNKCSKVLNAGDFTPNVLVVCEDCKDVKFTIKGATPGKSELIGSNVIEPAIIKGGKMEFSNVKLLRCTTDPEELIEYAGRKSHLSECNEETRGQFIQRIIRLGHISVLEHASASFDLTQMSRACSHQLVRHRIASYTQRSQRYTKQGVEEFVYPDSAGISPEVIDIFSGQFESAHEAYEKLISLGVKREDARYILPAASMTEMVLTMNFSSLRHFFEIRLDRKAQLEIRQYAYKMLELVMQEAPDVFGDIHNKVISTPGNFVELGVIA